MKDEFKNGLVFLFIYRFIGGIADELYLYLFLHSYKRFIKKQLYHQGYKGESKKSK